MSNLYHLDKLAIANAIVNTTRLLFDISKEKEHKLQYNFEDEIVNLKSINCELIKIFHDD